MNDAPILWQKGGEAHVLVLIADRITLRSTIPSAPGSRPEAALRSGASFKVKVARCRKEEAGFVIEGRLIDTTRPVRLAIEALLPK
ncbi:MAG: hypothetical protein ABI193_19375 [Minicystis sp.]